MWNLVYNMWKVLIFKVRTRKASTRHFISIQPIIMYPFFVHSFLKSPYCSKALFIVLPHLFSSPAVLMLLTFSLFVTDCVYTDAVYSAPSKGALFSSRKGSKVSPPFAAFLASSLASIGIRMADDWVTRLMSGAMDVCSFSTVSCPRSAVLLFLWYLLQPLYSSELFLVRQTPFPV